MYSGDANPARSGRWGNDVEINRNVVVTFGAPVLNFPMKYRNNKFALVKDLAEPAGVKNITAFAQPSGFHPDDYGRAPEIDRRSKGRNETRKFPTIHIDDSNTASRSGARLSARSAVLVHVIPPRPGALKIQVIIGDES